jgi:hypothetical protein
MKRRVSLFILLICFFSLWNDLTGSAPDSKYISFHFKNVPLISALKQLSYKYNFNFIFDDALVEDIDVTCDVVKKPPKVAFKNLFHSCQLSCEFLNQYTIIIRPGIKKVQPSRILRGRVSDAETNLPLVSANAYIQGKNIGSATDINGYFTFEIPDSATQLVVSYIGYDTRVLPLATGTNHVDIRLFPRPFEFNSIIITAPRTPEEVAQLNRTQLNEEYFIGVIPVYSTEMTYASFMNYNNHEVYFNNINGENTFYIKITGNRLHPMICTDRNNRLAYMQHQVKLNGFSLQTPFHSTIVPAMNPAIVNYDLIQHNKFISTVFDAEYENAYESVMEFEYRRGNPNRISGKVAIDLITSGFTLEGPLTGTSSWIISFRKSYTNDLLNSKYKNKWISYDYYDFQTQLDFQPADHHQTRVNYIYSTDQSSFDPRINYLRERTLYNSTMTLPQSEPIRAEEHIQETNFLNNQFSLSRISASDIYHISDHWQSEVKISYSEQNYLNEWAWSVNHNMKIPEITDTTYNYVWSEGKDSFFGLNSWEEKFILHFSSSPEYSMKAGIQFEQLKYFTQMKNNLMVKIGDFISEPPNYNLTSDNTNSIRNYSWFYQFEGSFLPNHWFLIGLRYDHFNMQQEGYLNPRIMMHYNLPLDIKTKFAFGSFSRIPQFGEIQQYMLEQFKPGYKPGDSKVEFQHTNKFMIGFEKKLISYILLDCNYFYKEMKNVTPINRLSDGSLIYDVTNKARASSHGVLVNANLNFHMLSLMGRYKYTDSFEQSPDKFPYAFYADQQHTLFLSLSIVFPDDWYIGTQVIYGSGYAYTPCILPEYDWELGYDLDSTPIWEYQSDRPNSARYPGYGRLDIMFRKGFTLPFGKITLSANLINVLNTHQTFSYIYTYDQNGQPIRQSETLSPFFPQVGFAYEF